MTAKLLRNGGMFYSLLSITMVIVLSFAFGESAKAQLVAAAEDTSVYTEQEAEEVAFDEQEQLQAVPDAEATNAGVSTKEFLIFLVLCCSWSWFVIFVLGQKTTELFGAVTQGEKLACLCLVSVFCSGLATWLVYSFVGYHESLLAGFLMASWMFVFMVASVK